MKKHNRKLFLIAMLALTAMMLFSAACAEEADGAQKNAEAMAAHAPAVTTLENGVQVQKIPNDPYIWNTAILQSQTRGCTACHALEDAVQKLPLTHPELWNPYNVDMTVNFCYMCHSKALFIQDSMHTLHLSSKEFTDTYNGNCLSCHQISTSTGEFQLWDNVKYDVMMGVSGIANVQGEFSYTQDSVTPTEEVFFYWENGDHRGITPDNDLDPAILENWTISVEGLVDNPFTFTLGEMKDQAVTKVLKMHCQTNPPAGSYIANCEVTGIPLSIILEKAGVQAEANTLRCVADDGWCYPLPYAYMEDNEPMLVYLINGAPLPNLLGYPVQLWTPNLGGVHFTKRIATISLTNEAAVPKYYVGFPNPKTGEFFNKPNVAIFHYTEGQIFPVGEPITFEGFVDAYDVPMAAVEISMDKGATWTRYDLDNPTTEKWVNWSFTWTPEKAGSYVIKVRGIAEDGLVSVMPATLMFNAK